MEIHSQSLPVASAPQDRFRQQLAQHGTPLRRGRITTLQINVGKLCNQTCSHCHVDAGPKRKEVMEGEVVERLLALAGHPDIDTVDLTGGAPEMNPHFARIVRTVRGLGKQVLVRCNLTIINEPGFAWLPAFYAEQGVQLICSLPCYTAENVDAQRGDGVFERSIAALQALNAQGFGKQGRRLALHLVYNPLGAFLPGDQAGLEAEYKRRLGAQFGIEFSRLLTLANLPIGRFGRGLKRSSEYEPYLRTLEDAFNPETVPHLMCRNTLSVGWDGRLYDCDFNQMLELELDGGSQRLGQAFSLDALESLPIRTGEHCLGCTAGAGSSCGGALA